jgi:hypothetical protein
MVATSTRWDAEKLISVVIPVLDDADALAALLPALPAADPALEIIVVNGREGSNSALDALRKRHSGVRWMQAAAGRGAQMNHGARHARGHWLVFLQLGTHDGTGLRLALLRDTLESVSALAAEKAVLYTPADRDAEIRAVTPFQALFLPQHGSTLGIPVETMPMSYDVDSASDLRRVWRHSEHPNFAARYTRALAAAPPAVRARLDGETM